MARLFIIQDKVYHIIIKQTDFDLLKTLCAEVYGTEGKPQEARKCTSKVELQSAVQFILGYCNKVPSVCQDIYPKIAKFHEEQLKSSIKDSNYEAGARTLGSYVGLKNLGCTCYINCLLQQFYMMPELRHAILDLDTTPIQAIKCDHVIPNLQKIFAYLTLSHQQYFVPSEFCKEFKNINGQPINVLIQQDVDEFFNMLTEKFESELKIVMKESLLKETLEIGVEQVIESLETDINYRSTRPEQYLSLPLDIKNKQTLQEALDLFVKEECLEGDNMVKSDEHEKKFRASKKCVINHLPKTVVLNLKRFEFNYNTMLKEKLNDYCEFPLNINFQKWTVSYNADPKEFDYDLVGVVVHSGTAEGGHYFSYIKERDPDSPKFGQWFEFNDTRVTPFNINELKQKTFGRATKRETSGLFDWDTTAYLLVYQKKEEIQMNDVKAQSRDKFSVMILQDNINFTNTRIVKL